jgi:hypothetical protein
LVEIRVGHPFYASGLCAGARVVPQATAAARLRGLRLLAKEAVGGLTLLADLSADGKAIVTIPPTTLRFDLLKLPGGLEAATDLGAIAAGAVFTDAGATKPMRPIVPEERMRETIAKPAGTVAVALAGAPLDATVATDIHVLRPADGVSVAGYAQASKRVTLDGPAAEVELDYPVAPRHSPDTLATIEIGIGPETVAKAAAGKPRRFTIALKAAAARWCYHLVTDLANPLAEWRITHPEADGPPANFGAAGLAEIAAPDAGDSFGSELLQRSAPLRVLRFVSDAPVACSEKPARRLALFAGDRQLFTALPNPPPTALRLVEGRPAFGEVLRFVTA